MKNSYSLNAFAIIVLILSLSIKSEANRDNHKNLPTQLNSEGVSQDWLTDARDEDGNKILSNNGEFKVDPPETDSAVYNLALDGEGSFDRFGYYISSGDVNGDGYSDVIVGADTYDNATGRVYIFYGGSPMNNVADVTMTGEGSGQYFGSSVGSGDLNGDGYSDVIVGAVLAPNGKAYIFYGGSSMNNVADLTMSGELPNSRFGNSVSSCDVNHDGYSDAIVGAYGQSIQAGRVYIYFGGSSMNNVADVTMNGEFDNNQFGVSLSSAGDVNNDGYSDVIVGANGYSSNTGRAYVFFGGASMNNVVDVTIDGPPNSQFGYSVSSAGDVNKDGYSDVIIGAFAYNSNAGAAYIFHGGTSMDPFPDLTLSGAAGTLFGRAVSSAGDINNDGYSDVIVGGYGYNSNTGRAFVYYGGSPMNNVSDVTMIGQNPGDFFGYFVCSAGDPNGDGTPDVVVSARAYNNFAGRAYMYYSPNIPVAGCALKFDGVNDNVSLPNSLTAAATGGTAITIEYWFKGSSLQSAVRFQNGPYIVSGWSGMHIISSDGGLSGISVGAAATDGNWHHVAMTWQKNTVYGFRSYLDGNLVDSRNSANVNLPFMNSGGFLGSINGTNEFMNGSLDQVRIWNRALEQWELQAFKNCEFPNQRPGLLAYYTFNHGNHGAVNPGLYTLPDFSGNNHMGILNNFSLFGLNSNWIAPGGVTTGVNCSEYASALNFDGINDYVRTSGGLAYAVSNTTAITIEYWFKGTSNQSAVRFQDNSGSFIVAGWNGGHIISSDGGTSGIPQGAAATDGNWHHVAMTWQKNTVNGFRSFLDGQLVYQRNSANVNLPTFPSIGVAAYLGSFLGQSEFMAGSLDEVRIWNRALTQSEIQFSMNCEVLSTAPGLIANYHLNLGIAGANNAGLWQAVDATGIYNGFLENFALNGSASNWIYPGGVVTGNTCIGGVLNITAVPEGFYNAASNRSNKKDTINAYLHSNVSPYGVVDFAKTRMDSVSLTGSFNFLNAGNGTYYIRLNHRNSIETWSKSGGEVYNASYFNSYDFTNSDAQSFGNNMKQVDASPVRFAVYSGDVNQDGTIDLTDIILCYNDANLFLSGYVNTDLTGDDFVDLTDITIAFNNSNNFVSKITP